MLGPTAQIQQFVRESNLIENEIATKGLYWDVPLRAAVEVLASPRVYLRDVCSIHALFGTCFDFDVPIGIYRSEVAFVNNEDLPLPQYLPSLMQAFHHKLQNTLLLIVNAPEKIVAERAWEMHDEFVCIHPFKDGNGKTCILVLLSVMDPKLLSPTTSSKH